MIPCDPVLKFEARNSANSSMVATWKGFSAVAALSSVKTRALWLRTITRRAEKHDIRNGQKMNENEIESDIIG